MKKIFLLAFALILGSSAIANKPKIIAYYTGNAQELKQYHLEQISHLIYSFAQLKGNSMDIIDSEKKNEIKEIVALKIRYPNLKVMIFFGGWSACAECSDLFADSIRRKAFVKSVLQFITKNKLDGIDLDWEYPAIEGFPGHKYQKADKIHFTKLVKELRTVLPPPYILSFAAGGFKQYLEKSIDWKSVIPLVDFVNLMTYDLVGGYATTTGHHTPLYSYLTKQESTDSCVKWLIKHKVPSKKLIIGAAMYARVWEEVKNIQNGLFQPGKFKEAVSYANFEKYFTDNNGYQYYWDERSEAPYQYNSKLGLFATFDDGKSVHKKSEYVLKNRLGGIMFWELKDDIKEKGLLNEMWETFNQ